MSDKERSMEIADRIVDQWANTEAGPLDIPKGRLWILRQDVAEAIRKERGEVRETASALDRAATAIDGLLIMMAQTESDMDYNAVDRAFDVLIAARQRNPNLPLSIPLAFEIIRRTAGEPPSKTWQELRERAIEDFDRVTTAGSR
jgi:hypothetical protein